MILPVDSAALASSLTRIDGEKAMLLQRVLTAVILLVGLILLAVLSSPFAFAVATALLTLLTAAEWTRLVGLPDFNARAGYLISLTVLLAGAFYLIGVTPAAESLDMLRVITVMILGCVFWVLAVFLMAGFPANVSAWNDQSHIALMGIFVLVPTWCGIVQLKYLDSTGALFLLLVATVSVADIGAYFAGRTWGRSKLAPKLSPGKSWAGFWGGVSASVVLAVVVVLIANGRLVQLNQLQAVLLIAGAVLVSVSSVVGDLFESMLKRNRQLKDSGNILPGHGGILDRIDSLTAATPVYVLWVFLVIGVG
jgi:phosphatidate cytidylyltransferase